MKIKSLILIWGNLLIIIFSLGAQERFHSVKDTSKLFFPNEYFVDTINTFGKEMNNDFYKIRIQGDWYKNSMYSEQLLRLKEPKLYQEYPYEVYRFTWFGYIGRTYNPISLRLENYNDTVFLFVKYIYSKGKKYQNELITDTITLNKNDWDIFKNKIDSLNFWNIPPIEKTSIVTMDGSTWIFEGKKDSLYHMVHRVCGSDTEIGELCLYLLKKSKIKIKKKEFY